MYLIDNWTTNNYNKEVENLSTIDYYESVLMEFKKRSIILQLMPDTDRLGVFLYSVIENRIVYANKRFLTNYHLDLEHLNRAGIRRFIFSRFHPEDAKAIENLELKAIKGQALAYLNKMIRIKMHDNIYHSFHFIVLELSSLNSDYRHLRVGVQLKASSFADDLNNKSEFSVCRRKMANLSKRECDILRLIVKGYTDNEIGQQLHISGYTSQKHRKNILKKLQVKNTASLSYIAGKSNLI